MVTLAVAEMLYAWGFRSKAFNGADGMGGIPRLDLSAVGVDLNDPGAFALAVIVACTLAWLVPELIVASPFGRTLDAIRQNPGRVAALGGGYSLSPRSLHRVRDDRRGGRRLQGAARQFRLARSGELARVRRRADRGGDRRHRHPGRRPARATLLVFLEELLSSSLGHWYLFLGAIFAAVALLMPRGIVGWLLDLPRPPRA